MQHSTRKPRDFMASNKRTDPALREAIEDVLTFKHSTTPDGPQTRAHDPDELEYDTNSTTRLNQDTDLFLGDLKSRLKKRQSEQKNQKP
jgi:hypothetical protein